MIVLSCCGSGDPLIACSESASNSVTSQENLEMSLAKTTLSLLLLSSFLGLAACGSSDTTGGGGGSSSAPTELTFDKNADEPRFSPDSATIAYVQTKETNGADLSVMDVTGNQRKALSPANDFMSAAAWSPDGKQIYFVSEAGISVVPAAGGTATVAAMAFAALDLDISPDGKSLVYAVNGASLELVDLANPAMPKSLGKNGTSPRFSPDGKSIVFESSKKINLMDIASGDVTEVVDGGTYLASAAWFPDGKRLAITSDKGIEIVTLGATPGRSVLNDQFAAKSVDVSPDGKLISYTVNGKKSIFVLSGF
jgi:Tol biopolymer transport system component